MGSLAHAHPFLDGNGRTIMVLHAEMALRAGISIDWVKTDKTAYLTALTAELNAPDKGYLDEYLKPLVGEAIDRKQSTSLLKSIKGLGEPAKTRDEILEELLTGDAVLVDRSEVSQGDELDLSP
jgi:cell filamentation protein